MHEAGPRSAGGQRQDRPERASGFWGTAAVPASAASRPLGAHVWAEGGLFRALERGADLGCDVVQVFTRNPNRWSSKPLTQEMIAACSAARERTGVWMVATHDSYLINLASPDPLQVARSLTAMEDELRRAELLGIPWVVTHLGAHLGEGVEKGLRRLAKNLEGVLASVGSGRVKIALELTAGQGTTLGFTFEQIATVLGAVRAADRFGVCVDTCHVHAAGYRWRGPRNYERLWEEFDRVLGLERLALVHVNDAKRERGSRIDRHEHLGKGRIGLPTFRRLVQDPRLATVPLILETPQAKTMHRENLQVLRSFRSRRLRRPPVTRT